VRQVQLKWEQPPLRIDLLSHLARRSGSWERRAALAGIPFVIFFASGAGLQAAASVDLGGTAAEVAKRYDDNETLLLLAERISVLAVRNVDGIQTRARV
jgi:hypothetical protein